MYKKRNIKNIDKKMYIVYYNVKFYQFQEENMEENLNNPHVHNDEELNEEDNIITLQNEDGEDVNFEFLDFVEFEGNTYVVLLPQEEDAEEVVILKEEGVTDDGENESYVSVEDDRILQSVFDIFKNKFSDEFDFED